MKFTGEQRERLEEAIIDAYDTEGLKRLVRYVDLTKRLEAIADGKTLTEKVFNLVGWVEANDKHQIFLEGLVKYNNTNQLLREIVDELLQSIDEERAPLDTITGTRLQNRKRSLALLVATIGIVAAVVYVVNTMLAQPSPAVQTDFFVRFPENAPCISADFSDWQRQLVTLANREQQIVTIHARGASSPSDEADDLVVDIICSQDESADWVTIEVVIPKYDNGVGLDRRVAELGRLSIQTRPDDLDTFKDVLAGVALYYAGEFKEATQLIKRFKQMELEDSGRVSLHFLLANAMLYSEATIAPPLEDALDEYCMAANLLPTPENSTPDQLGQWRMILNNYGLTAFEITLYEELPEERTPLDNCQISLQTSEGDHCQWADTARTTCTLLAIEMLEWASGITTPVDYPWPYINLSILHNDKGDDSGARTACADAENVGGNANYCLAWIEYSQSLGSNEAKPKFIEIVDQLVQVENRYVDSEITLHAANQLCHQNKILKAKQYYERARYSRHITPRVKQLLSGFSCPWL